MANRSHLAAPRYELPPGYSDAVAYDAPLLKGEPKVLPVRVATDTTVTKTDLAERLRLAGGFNKAQANAAVEVIFTEMARALAQGSAVRLRGVGTFRVVTEDSVVTKGRVYGRANAKYHVKDKDLGAPKAVSVRYEPSSSSDSAKRLID